MKIQELFTTARIQLTDIYHLHQNSDLRLEQVEFNEEEDVWEVVVSFLVQNVKASEMLSSAFGSKVQYERIYKMVKITQEKKIVGLYIFDK